MSGDHITYVANDSYWGGRPYLDEVTWKFIPDDNPQRCSRPATSSYADSISGNALDAGAGFFEP